ncbi:MAG: hypothetical protein WBM15_02505 [Chromatiaceae bacterium]
MDNKLLKFMESNTFDRGGVEMTSHSSLIFSGNLGRTYRGGVPAFLEPLACKTACKTFQDPGEKSVEMFPPQVVQCPAFCRRTLE